MNTEKIIVRNFEKKSEKPFNSRDDKFNGKRGGGKRDFKRNDRKPARKQADLSAFSEGEEFEGVVKSVLDFGAFISLKDGVDGLLHNSKIEGKLNVGDEISVKIEEIKNNKISLVPKDYDLSAPRKSNNRNNDRRSSRDGRGDRNNRFDRRDNRRNGAERIKRNKPDLSAFNTGDRFTGEVKNVLDFGAFIGLKDGIDGLLHVSKIKNRLNEGDKVSVKITDIKDNKISLDLV